MSEVTPQYAADAYAANEPGFTRTELQAQIAALEHALQEVCDGYQEAVPRPDIEQYLALTSKVWQEIGALKCIVKHLK